MACRLIGRGLEWASLEVWLHEEKVGDVLQKMDPASRRSESTFRAFMGAVGFMLTLSVAEKSP